MFLNSLLEPIKNYFYSLECIHVHQSKNLMWPTHNFLVLLFKYNTFAGSLYVIS
ncbi:hypothetical protein O3M35_011770 [Rhynocoris fuscipes]|uniref:Uncharacterized protein n=1 Tax=Rhynocoris fuscipes TaxID=488301 RepID=A0AAW1D035_9HEMI